MGGFLQLLRSGLGQAGDPAVVEHFRRLARTREPIEIEPLQVCNADGRQFSVVERVDDRSIVIGRPSGPGAHRPLIQFGAYTLLLPSPDGELAAETRVLCRAKVRSGARGELFCYRLGMPSSVHRVERRQSQRLLFGGDLMCEARIRAEGRASPAFGTFEELTADSARLRCRAPVPIVRGAAVHLDAELPAPVGSLQVVGEVVGIELPTTPEHAGCPLIHVRFLESVPAVKRALAEGLDRRRSA